MTERTGALRYMAPEVFLGKEYGLSADVYSFGVIAFNLVEGRQPGVSSSIGEFMSTYIFF